MIGVTAECGYSRRGRGCAWNELRGRKDKFKGQSPVPLILYSPVSWLFLLRTLIADDAFEPTVSTLSNPGCATSVMPLGVPGRKFSSATRAPGRRAKGLRIGMVTKGSNDSGGLAKNTVAN